MESWKAFQLANVIQLGGVLLKHSGSCFIYVFVFQVISEKILCNRDFISCLRNIVLRT